MGDSIQGGIYKIGPVKEDMYINIFRENFIIQLIDRSVNFLEHNGGVFVAEQLNNTLNTFAVFPLPVGISEYTFPFEITIFKGTQITQINRDTSGRSDNYFAKVIKIPYQSDTSDNKCKVPSVKHASPGIRIVFIYTFHHLAQWDIVFFKFLRIYFNLVLCCNSSEILNIGDTHHLFNPWNNHPFLKIRQFPQ